MVFSYTPSRLYLGDGAGTEVAAVGGDASELGVPGGAFGEAVDMDAVAVPVGGDGNRGGGVATLFRAVEDTGASLGAVHEDEGLVVDVGTDDRGVVVDGDVDLQRVVEGGVAELDFGEVTPCDDQVLVVDSCAAGDVAVDVAEVFADENVAFGHLARASDVGESFTDSREECTSETTCTSEADAIEPLVDGVGVTDDAFVATHYGFAFPERADHGADFSDESVKDSLLNFTHSVKEFWLVN